MHSNFKHLGVADNMELTWINTNIYNNGFVFIQYQLRISSREIDLQVSE